MTRAAIYTRLSSDPAGERAGVERQRTECQALATANGWDMVAIYEDNDVSAYSGRRRPGYEQAIADAGTGYDVLICWASDRLYRRMADLVRITSDLAPHVRIVTVMGGDVDLTTAEGILRAQVLGSVAEFESRRKAERVAARARQRAEQGRAVTTTRPFGWAWADPCPAGQECAHATTCAAPGLRPRQGTRKGLVPHPVESPQLVAAYLRISAGDSLRSVARALAGFGVLTVGGRPMDSSSLRSALLMPRNAGLVAHKDQIVAEACDGAALVDRGVWDRCRAVLTDPGRRTSPEHKVSTPLGGGLLTCGKCGGPMSASNKHDAAGKQPVYICSRQHHLTRRRALLDGPILDLARGLLTTLEDAGLLEVATRPDPGVDPLRHELAQAEQRLTAMAALVADGMMDPVDYAAAAPRLRARIADLVTRVARSEGRPASARLLASGGVGAAFDQLVEQARGGTPDGLRAVLRELVTEVRVLPPAVPGHPAASDVRITWAPWVPAGAPTSPQGGAPPRPSRGQRRAMVADLHARGASITRIAEQVGSTRGTVRADLAAIGAAR